MFDDDDDQNRDDTSADAKTRLDEKVAELRIHAELCAVFEGVRKYEAQLNTTLDIDLTRTLQKSMLKLTGCKMQDSPVLDPSKEGTYDLVWELLSKADELGLPTNDYHINRRPGEVVILRWLKNDPTAQLTLEQVDTFYTRLQAHFDAAINQAREDEHQALDWKSDAKTTRYLKLLDEVKINQAERYLRPIIKSHAACVLSQTTADELNISYLCDYVMGVSADEVVGPRSAPQDPTDESETAWFFRLFSLRGLVNDQEHMLFLAFMQKAQDTFDTSDIEDE
jgi:hypothetical protein